MKFYVLRLVDWLPNAVRQTNQANILLFGCIWTLLRPLLLVNTPHTEYFASDNESGGIENETQDFQS
jgi:hypothetical protein